VHLVAFRTNENAQGRNLNPEMPAPSGDGDDVLQVYDLLSGELQNTEQAVFPCTFAECDPRFPYRVEGQRVTFLTLECDQEGPETSGCPSGGTDLNNDGDASDLILQKYDFCAKNKKTVSVGAVRDGDPNPLDENDESIAFLADGGRCDLGVTCDPTNDNCADGAYCQLDGCDLDTGRCDLHIGLSCSSDADCGRCTLRQPSTCVTDADCPSGSCLAQAVVAVTPATDTDQDGVPDGQDNCPQTPNPSQAETMDFPVGVPDGVGDLCDSDFIRPVAGTSVFYLYPPSADDRKLLVLAKDAAIPALTGDGSVGPTITGGEIQIYNPTTLESATYDLPKEKWTALGNPPGKRGYKYKDLALTSGPCKTVTYAPGKQVRAQCQGSGLSFDLDEANQGSLAFRLRIGTAQQCLEFGGVGVIDVPGFFKARKAPPPPTCPEAP